MAQMGNRRVVLGGLVLCAGLVISGCGEKPLEVTRPLGTVTRVQFAFAGWNNHTQIDAAGRSISVQGMAPIPVSTAVELRESNQNAELLCVTGAQRCGSVHQPQQHDCILLNRKP